MGAIRDYLSDIQAEYKTSMAGEHAYRPALKKLLESADINLRAVNDPARTEIGMPDFVVLRQPGNIPIGIVEAKDIGNQLSRTERTGQIRRYLAHGNLILTNYLEFRWYVNGQKIETVRIARVKNAKITRLSTAYADLNDMLRRFARQTTQSVNSAQELAERLARSAQFIAHFIEKDLKSDVPSANLQHQLAAFQKTLLPGLDIPRFADMYAQTLAYGLFASRVNFPGDPAEFSLRGAAEDIPRTNPFLRDLFYHSRFDIGARLTWMAESLVEILRHTDMDGILAHFGQRTQQTDPVVHFYETFLSAYNPSLRETRGVYFTPEPVVKYIVRSVDHILKTRFDRPRGLADENALILDPAAGTGTFLYFVIEQIKEAFAGQQGLWKSYVEKHLLPRVFGFELLMAPYTVAHMNLSLQLKEAGYEFKEGERLGIYLTNSLEEAVEAPPLPFAEFIAEEANTAAEIKRDKPIMVVLGNPPYSKHSANRSEKVIERSALEGQSGLRQGTRTRKRRASLIVKTFIGKLLEDYKRVDGQPLGEKNPKWLQDDYVKFIRFGQWRIERTGEGVLAFITNHGFLDNPTFRGMRKSLLETFSEIHILDLHGNTNKSEVSPDGSKDVNVFDIRTGVSISVLIKTDNSLQNAEVHHHEIWGSRETKYKWLNALHIATTPSKQIQPLSPHYLFIPQDASLLTEYNAGQLITDIFLEYKSTVTTGRNSFSIAFDSDTLMTRIRDLQNLDLSNDMIRDKYALRDVSYWKLDDARAEILKVENPKDHILAYCYRPLDFRFVIYHSSVVERQRYDIMQYMEQENFALLTHRPQSPDSFTFMYCTELVGDQNVAANKSAGGGNSFQFPLYLYPHKTEGSEKSDDDADSRKRQRRILDAEEADYFDFNEKGRRPNLSTAFVSEMEAKLGLPFQTEGGSFVTPTPNPSPIKREGLSSPATSSSRPSSPSLPVGEGAGGWGVTGRRAKPGGWFGPEDVFYYAYAVFHSPTYRQRYAEFLKIDFPRLPLTSNLSLFATLVKLGAELVSLHLMKSPKLSNFSTTFDIEGDNEVARGYPKYSEAKARVEINKAQYFGGVTSEIWDFHIGGYRVAEKWLKDRRGRKLSYEDLTHYQKIIVALSETRRVMSEIDHAIPGFPIE